MLERLLNFLRENLLATGVDSDGLTPVQLQRVVLQQPHLVTGHRIANPVNHRKRGFGLGFVVQIAQWDVAGPRPPTQAFMSWREFAAQVLRQHRVVRRQPEPPCGSAAPGVAHLCALATRFRRAGGVDDGDVRQGPQQFPLQLGRHDRATGDDVLERGEVSRATRQLVHQGTSERVADQQQVVDPLAFHDAKDIRRIEAAHFVLNHHRATGVERLERHPMPRPMHEGRRRQVPPMGGFGAGDILPQALQHRAIGAAGTQRRDQDVRVAPEHTLGHAGGAARVQHV